MRDCVRRYVEVEDVDHFTGQWAFVSREKRDVKELMSEMVVGERS